jgi:hypothetical protein
MTLALIGSIGGLVVVVVLVASWLISSMGSAEEESR